METLLDHLLYMVKLDWDIDGGTEDEKQKPIQTDTLH